MWRFFVMLKYLEQIEGLLEVYGSRERSSLEGAQQETCSLLGLDG
jgi:hypothetical protein